MLCHLHKHDHNGSLVLGHELLLLACSQCCWKRGGARGLHCAGPIPLDRLLTCTFKTLEHTVQAADTIQLECLAWVVFDNIMGLGKATTTFWIRNVQPDRRTSSGQSIQGIAYALPSTYIYLFWCRSNNCKARRPRTKETCKVSALFHDARCEERVYRVDSTLKEKQESLGKDQSLAPMHPVDPNIQGMKWMKEHQCSYKDVQLGFWLVLRPLMDGGEESTCQLAHRLLSMWQWSLAVYPPTYPPAPTSMNIGYWL